MTRPRRPSRAARRGERFRQLGFWSQLIILGLVDWGSALAFAKYGAPWYHWLGFVVVNAVLLGLTGVMWRWMRLATPRACGE